MVHAIFSIRILPHHQDTGGFFVTVLEKVKPLPWEKNIKQSEDEIEKPINENKRRKEKKRRYQGYREDPFVFMTEDDPIWPAIR